MRCAYHPDVETNLTCNRCGKPICPRCMVQTPVGAKCPDCARMTRLPIFQVSAVYYLRGAGAGLVAGGVLGLIWPFIPLGGFLLFIIGAGVGYGIGELISLAVNKKRSPGLQVIAGLCVAEAYGIRTLIESPHFFTHNFFNIFGILALALGIVVAAGRLK